MFLRYSLIRITNYVPKIYKERNYSCYLLTVHATRSGANKNVLSFKCDALYSARIVKEACEIQKN